jgi:hypothetical protein
MKRGWLLNTALLVAVALLTWLALRMPSREEAAREPLSAVRPTAVSRITLTRQNRPPIAIERRGEQWWITAPLKARADEFQVMRMLTILDAQPTARLPATDPSRFELNPPSAILDIDNVQYAFGSINTVTREQYVQRGDTVYAVELRHGAALPAQPDALIRRALLGESELPVAITLRAFSVRKTDGRWVLTPASENAGADELQRYVDQWRQASATAVAPYDNKPPLSDIEIELTDKTVLKLGLLQREPQLILWRRDNGLQYVFPAVAGRALLDPPGIPEKSK